MKKGTFLALGAALLLALSACNMPGSGNSAAQVQTAAAETVSANLTESALLTPSATNTLEPSNTPEPSPTSDVTNTPFPSPVSGGGGGGGNSCDSIQFVSDVTIPDGQQVPAGDQFTKTWRLRNAGTCTWTTGYSVVFVSGNSMNGPASQPLTANVVPGSTVDISVTLTAPTASGQHQGNWALRNASNQNFGHFFVIINTGGAQATGSPGSGNTFNASSVGQVDANGAFASAAHAGANSDVGVRGFVAFNISSIPSNATITEVRVDFSNFDTMSNPFATMGCLQGFAGSFFPLSAASYNASGAGPDMQWCSSGDLSTVFINDAVKNRLQSAVTSGATSLEYQLRFNGAPTGTALVRFLSSPPKLIVSYTTP
ncbi:MAG: hypothetical protein KIS85_08520 [Anaerolineales bacterium]|nr:hypothetical protein [Anaerolineales bacterium]